MVIIVLVVLVIVFAVILVLVVVRGSHEASLHRDLRLVMFDRGSAGPEIE